ncbi:hypothetical protein PHYSODRAFT_528003 [Phytophthora sojae]|uniref:Uncharacterized protein n=1 Tax=Phytophthora sojae (strain P6497) TaxID=1094619 RepID=G5AAM8_PHYSP|nr:hypothetical protein PHYSODRAFT_528003 [Phytophthora sojae]EGZ07657.1 hypothetical protein PHYSODRAFT_528003 [Phytophthora sojae]|eukprot:XP_009537223.1 hypothetical protein PHYSODRAFT_528003 [Phytophthora sojae]
METSIEVIEWCFWSSLVLWRVALTVLCKYWWVTVLLVVGAIGGVVTRPLWSIAGRRLGAVFAFVYKWSTLARMYLRRYRRFVNGPAVQGRQAAERRWKAFEAIWATPMIVLEAREEHTEGLGRLLHKWLEAYHALWCVFLPDVLELSCKSTAKYWKGSKVECRRTVDRANCVCRGFWAFASLLAYALFYTVVFVYDFVERVCQGTVGVAVLLLTLNYMLAEGGLVVGDGLVPDETVVRWSCYVVATCVASHLCGATSGGRSPLKMAEDRYSQWQQDLEELEQAERLSEAFWRADGCVGDTKPVRTLGGLRAEQRELRAKMQADKLEAARRGRRVSVGEDVPSRNGHHRSYYTDDRSTCYRLLEDQLLDDAVSGQSSISEGR